MEFTPHEYPLQRNLLISQEYPRQRNLLMLPLFKRSFSTVPLSYSYGVVVESIEIVDSINAALAYDDDHFQALRVSEK